MILDININVINERIEIKTKHVEPSDSLNYIKCKFHFLTDDWDDLDARIAIFKNSSYNVEEQMLISSTDNSCYVPPVVFEHPGVVQVSVRGDKYQGGLVVFRIDTGITEFLLDKDSVIAGSGISDITPTKYEAFLADFNAKAQEWFDKFNIEILTSKSWAIGGTGIRVGEDTNNSRYWAEKSEEYSDISSSKVDDSEEFALLSEQYAKGTRNGEAITSELPGYHDNAYYYKEQSRGYSEEAASYIEGIEQYVSEAEAYAHTAETEADNAATSADSATAAATAAASSASSASSSASSAAISADAILDLTVDSEVLEPGSTPTVDRELDDDHYNLHFKLAQGPKGDTGSTGPQGEKGDPGEVQDVYVDGESVVVDSIALITLPDISTKQDKDIDAVSENIAIFDAYGDTVDSGSKIVTSVSNISTDTEIPTAKAVYDSINPSIPIATWASGTDAQLASMLQAHREGRIDLRNYWSVGDTRTVHISNMAGLDYHNAQDVTFILADTNLTGLVSAGEYPLTFVVVMGCQLEVHGKYNLTAENLGGWKDSARREWCNETFPYALPQTFRKLFLPFEWYAGNGDGYTPNIYSVVDLFALPPNKCVFGSRGASKEEEANKLAQWSWYATADHRETKRGINGPLRGWWNSSCDTNNTTCGTYVGDHGNLVSYSVDRDNGLLCFGCI